MPVLGIDAGVLAGLQVLNAANPTDDPNHGAKPVVLFKEPGERGMSLTYVWFKSDYPLPRHSTDNDRQSVVSGQSVHVRVALGGSRRLKKTGHVDIKHA